LDPGSQHLLSVTIYAAIALGLRHALESHNIAAIGDFTTSAPSSARAIGLTASYTLGHVLAIAAIGSLSVVFGLSLPKGAGTLVERLVGATLIVFGSYVLYVLFAQPGMLVRYSRVTLIAAAIRRAFATLSNTARSREHAHPATPARARASFVLGLVHGVGLETPTQLALFVLAAGSRRWEAGLSCVVAFVTGLAAMTGIMAAVSAGLFRFASAVRWLQAAVMFASGVYSVALGAALMIGAIS
jgi:high-affinity nickel-transport protein